MTDISISSSGGGKGLDKGVNAWVEQIELGEKYRDTYSCKSKWPTYRDMYRGKWAAGIKPVNKVFSYGRALIPRIYFRNPRVLVRPNKPEYTAGAALLEVVINWLLDVTQVKKTLKRASLHAYISGIGPIKLGYDSQFLYDPSHAVDKDSATVNQVGRKGGLIEFNTNVQPGMPWALPVMPEHLITPWGYTEVGDMPWICNEVWRPLEDLKADNRYKNTSKLTGETLKDAIAKTVSGNTNNYAKIYEICDYRHKERISICENIEIYKGPDILQEGGIPYECIIFNEDPEYFWPISDCSILEPDQLELNEVRTQQAQHRAVTLLKFLYLKGAVKHDELEKFLSGNVGPAIEVDGESLANSIVTLQPHMPPELWRESQEIIANIRESMGFSENQVSNFAQKQNTSATEASLVNQSFEARIDERKDVIADVLRNIIKKWNSMIFKLWDGTRVARIVGPEGQSQWVEFTGQDLEGDYTFHIDVESGFPVTSQVRREVAQGIFKTYNGDQLIDQMAIRQIHLGQYEDVIPGLRHLVVPPQAPPPGGAPGATSQDIAAGRQPAPAYGSGGSGGRPSGSPGGNQGGGARSAVADPMSFDKFRAQRTGVK